MDFKKFYLKSRLGTLFLVTIVASMFLFASNVSASKRGYLGVNTAGGMQVNKFNTNSYESVGLFYFDNSEFLEIGYKFLRHNSNCNNMHNLYLTKYRRISYKGLFYSWGLEVNKVKGELRDCENDDITLPIFPYTSIGVFLTKRKVLSLIEVSAHLSRVEFGFKIGF